MKPLVDAIPSEFQGRWSTEGVSYASDVGTAHDGRVETTEGTQARPQTAPVAREARDRAPPPAARYRLAAPLDPFWAAATPSRRLRA